MVRDNTDKLLETIKSFVDDLELIEKASTQVALSSLERRAVNKLQLAQVEIELAGRDLYDNVQKRRSELRKGSK